MTRYDITTFPYFTHAILASIQVIPLANYMPLQGNLRSASVTLDIGCSSEVRKHFVIKFSIDRYSFKILDECRKVLEYRNYNTDLIEKRTIDKWKGEFIHQIVREMRCLQNQNI